MSGRDAYFLKLQSALHAAAIANPVLVIDLARLNANIDTLLADLPEGMAYRIVAKSLPSPDLLAHVMARAGTDRLMTFNLPMLSALARSMPDADQLLGKPLPAAAARAFYAGGHDGARVKWLIDTPERLDQYAQIASDYGVALGIVLELDVGLHRGGFEPNGALRGALEALRASNRLTFAGFMGYEPHLAALPTALGWRERATKGAWATYAAAVRVAADVLGANVMDGALRNAAGSPTYRLYTDTSIANEVSVGSALVKPTHFDTPLLQGHQAAAFIAAPVLKTPGDTRMPGLEFADAAKRLVSPATSKTVFTYGGNWMADPVDPPGLSYNKIFGRSSNQEMLNGGPDLDVSADDFIFLRPHQSEAVFLQFGDIAVYDEGRISTWWTVFPASA